ncbi:hypothetical protein PIB30_024756 [Stylosanthes scabra]|uniref:Uncharacterized protein n=1 Tax=Stylosanthes scabra TaxID=79078 RepID=A0ABU6T9M3_9FABA|nr:hypothetical protein [Stylosanthes scabra]
MDGSSDARKGLPPRHYPATAYRDATPPPLVPEEADVPSSLLEPEPPLPPPNSHSAVESCSTVGGWRLKKEVEGDSEGEKGEEGRGKKGGCKLTEMVLPPSSTTELAQNIGSHQIEEYEEIFLIGNEYNLEKKKMENNVSMTMYYNGQILFHTPEGARFVCNNSCVSVVYPIISFEELKSFICQNIDLQILKRVSNIFYRRPVLVFDGFIQFQAICVIDDASVQEMFSIYYETRSQVPVIELYVESESDDEFKGTYELDDDNENNDQSGHNVEEDVANALEN